MSQVVQQWWDKNHVENCKRYLTGSSGRVVWDFLAIDDLLMKGTCALEIGVGLGVCTKDTVDRGVQLSVLDISRVGLARVADITEAQYQNPLELPSSTFGVVFSYLVAQHMSDEDLIFQIREVLRSLKSYGILAIQFADGEQMSQTDEGQMRGGVCRSVKEVQRLVEIAGGRIVWEGSKQVLKVVSWYAVHVGR